MLTCWTERSKRSFGEKLHSFAGATWSWRVSYVREMPRQNS